MDSYITYFKVVTQHNDTIPKPYILIQCIDRGWNDFGYNYRARLTIQPSDERGIFDCDIQVMPVQNGLPVGRLASWVDTLPKKAESDFIKAPENAAENINFLSLLASENDYRMLSDWASNKSEFHNILASISDIVYIRTCNIYPRDSFSSLINSKNFRVAMLRSGSSYQAFHRGWRAIVSSSQINLNDSRQDFNFECKLNGFELSDHSLFFEFINTDLYEDRVHCLIGINGTGKTRLLRELLLTLGNRIDNSEMDLFLDNKESGASESKTNAPAFNRVLTFSSDLQHSYPSGTRTDSPFEYRHFVLVQTETGNSQISALDPTPPQSMARMLVSMIRDPDYLSDNLDRYSLFKKSLCNYVDFEKIHIPVMPEASKVSNYSWTDFTGKKWIKLSHIVRAGGEERKLELTSMLDEDRDIGFFNENNEKIQLSSGQLVFFKFGLHFISYADIGSLVILDEPETHLHPNLVSDFMSMLHEVLGLTKSIALIATHSPYVVREVPTHCVHVLTIDEEGSVRIGKVYLKTLGANISSISHAVFGDSTVKKYHERLAKELANSHKTLEQIIDSYKEILSPEMLIQIRHEIESNMEEI
jgi:hypothetical protein